MNKHLNNIIYITSEWYSHGCEYSHNMGNTLIEKQEMAEIDATFTATERACLSAQIHDELLER